MGLGQGHTRAAEGGVHPRVRRVRAAPHARAAARPARLGARTGRPAHAFASLQSNTARGRALQTGRPACPPGRVTHPCGRSHTSPSGGTLPTRAAHAVCPCDTGVLTSDLTCLFVTYCSHHILCRAGRWLAQHRDRSRATGVSSEARNIPDEYSRLEQVGAGPHSCLWRRLDDCKRVAAPLQAAAAM